MQPPIILVAVAILLPALPSGSRADDEVVTNCTSDAEVRQKLGRMQGMNGGTLSFACGANPPTIRLSSELPSILTATTIDGGSTITLSGEDATRIVSVYDRLTLQGVWLAAGRSTDSDGGGAVFNGGTLVVTDSFIHSSTATTGSGGAIFSAPGSRLEIANSLLTFNRAVNGGAIFAYNDVQVTIRNSGVNDNVATGETVGAGWGGALLLWEGADATIEGGTFIANSAREGGAIQTMFDGSSLTVRGTTFIGNDTRDGSGGAIRLGPVPTAAGSLGSGSGVVLEDVALRLNDAGGGALAFPRGGGVYCEACVLRIARVTFEENGASNRGGGLFVTGLVDDATVRNATFYRNTAGIEGGGIYFGGSTASLTLNNVTVGSNSAGTGGGVASANSHLSQHYLLLDRNENGNCLYRSSLATDYYNLSSDGTCEFPREADGRERNNLDLRLSPIDDNGGPTRTQLPLGGSPTIDGGTPFGCPPTDQRGAPRPFGETCDVGAVEVGGPVPSGTTTTTPGSTPTTTTLPSGTCSAPCATTDPCRPQACVEGACLAQQVAGFVVASCACQRPLPAACAERTPPTKLRKVVLKACSLIDAAAAAPSGRRRVRKQLVKAGRKWREAGRLVYKRPAQRILGDECVRALAADYDDAENRANAVREAAGG